MPKQLLQARRWALDAAIVADMLAIACTLWVVLGLGVPDWQAWTVETWTKRAGNQFSPDAIAGAAHVIAPQALELCAIPAATTLMGALLGLMVAIGSMCRRPLDDAGERPECDESALS